MSIMDQWLQWIRRWDHEMQIREEERRLFKNEINEDEEVKMSLENSLKNLYKIYWIKFGKECADFYLKEDIEDIILSQKEKWIEKFQEETNNSLKILNKKLVEENLQEHDKEYINLKYINVKDLKNEIKEKIKNLEKITNKEYHDEDELVEMLKLSVKKYTLKKILESLNKNNLNKIKEI